MDRNRLRVLARWLCVLAALAAAACHREVPVPPLPERNIVRTDNFFDVWPTSPTRAFIVGARGKVLLTEDGGKTFKRIPIGTDLAVFGIQMIGDTGFLCGQDGMIMRSHDSGLTWQKLDSRTHLFIFALSFPDKDHGFLVGDRSLVLSTTNGGDTFTKRQLQRIFPVDQQDYALPYEEPLLYGVSFVNDDQGWVVGEFGRIWATDNGGQTWTEQQDSLLPQWKRPLNPSDDPRFADFNLPTMFGVSFRDAQHGYAAGLEGSVVATDDGGKTWHFQQQAERPGAPPDAFQPGERAAGPRDPLFAIQVFGNDQGMTVGLTGSALRLQPNGVWAHDASLPALPFGLNQVRFFDDQHGWIVGYGVVLYTDDGGKTWRFCQG